MEVVTAQEVSLPAATAVAAFEEHAVGAFQVGQDYLAYREGDQPPFQVTANHVRVNFICSDSAGSRWTFCLTWKTPDGKVRHKLIPVPRLIGDWQGLMAELANEGLFVQAEGVRLFRSYLSLACGSPDLQRVRLLTEIGFFPVVADEPDGAFGFMLPSGPILPEGVSADNLRYLPPFEYPALAAYHSAGSLEDWRQAVAPMAGNPLTIVAMCAGLAGGILPLSGSENAGFHFHGISSSGKTTACQSAMSIWGCAADPQSTQKPTLFQTWAATDNGRELMAASCSGGPMFLDEIGAMPPGLAVAVYPLLNGRGKTRMNEYGGMRTQHSWQTFVLSTGEVSVYQRIMQEAQRQAMTGELVRLLDIPVDNLPQDPALSAEQAQELARHLKTVVAEVYGSAGPAFIRDLQDAFPSLGDLRENLMTCINDAYVDLCAALSKRRPLSAPHKRALRHFALPLAVGRWAADSVFPFSEDVIDRSVIAVAEAWFDGFPLLSEHDRLLDGIRKYVIDQRFHLVDAKAVDERQMAGRGAPVMALHDGRLWMSPECFQHACGDMLAKRAAKLLDRLGILHRHDGDSQHKVKITFWPRVFKGQRYYALLADRVFAEQELEGLVSRGAGERAVVREFLGDDADDDSSEFAPTSDKASNSGNLSLEDYLAEEAASLLRRL